MDELDSMHRYQQPLINKMIDCIQYDEFINSNAIHPAVVYAAIGFATALVIGAPFLFTGLLAFFCVMSAIFIYVQVGPGSHVFDAMCSEEHRCEQSYLDSVDKVNHARRHYHLFTASAPTLPDEERVSKDMSRVATRSL